MLLQKYFLWRRILTIGENVCFFLSQIEALQCITENVLKPFYLMGGPTNDVKLQIVNGYLKF